MNKGFTIFTLFPVPTPKIVTNKKWGYRAALTTFIHLLKNSTVSLRPLRIYLQEKKIAIYGCRVYRAKTRCFLLHGTYVRKHVPHREKPLPVPPCCQHTPFLARPASKSMSMSKGVGMNIGVGMSIGVLYCIVLYRILLLYTVL